MYISFLRNAADNKIKADNQKQELPVAVMFVNRSGQN